MYNASTGTVDASGLITSTEVTYNSLNQAVVQKDVRGFYSYKVYDQSGRVAYDIDSEGYVTRFLYNSYDEQISLRRYSAKIVTSGLSGWTAGTALTLAQLQTPGVIVSNNTTDRVLVNTFDARGLKTSVTQAAISYVNAAGTTTTGSPVTQFSFDAYGNLVKEAMLLEGTPGNSNAVWANTFHYYDELGRRLQSVDAEGYVTTWTYNAQGQVLEQVEHARAISTVGLITTTPAGLPTAGDATTGFDRITRWSYDVLGRKATETSVRHYQDANGNASVRDLVTALNYDAENHATGIRVDGVLTKNAFDALGRATS
ncbi:MAG: hypothetical protein ACREPB_00545, partial [Arenimonas sp.]